MDLSYMDAKGFSKWLNNADKNELSKMISYCFEDISEGNLISLFRFANELRESHYGKKVYFRGLIEFSSYCKNDCFYCGLCVSNTKAKRYRLSDAEILDCCKQGYKLGFRTFVLQGGEDAYYTDARMCQLISKIKALYPDCAITLSIGERSYESYKRLFDAGADRYLLRHETANKEHYAKLHPPKLSLENRKRCLYDLKEIGFQVGAGFMVDSPFQTVETLAEDLLFLKDLQPHMIGIGPFIPHKETRFAGFYSPESNRTLVMLALVRIMLPKVLLPATTALDTVDKLGREKGFRCGANVVMPNLSPAKHRADYALYDDKLCTGLEAGEHIKALAKQIEKIGCEPDFSRGDYIDFQEGRM